MITWVASYPKSGNTWMRVFLANLTSVSEVPVSINSLPETTHGAASRPLLDLGLGLETSDLTPEELDAARRPVYAYLGATVAVERLLKIHDANRAPGGGSLVPSKGTAGIIHVVRNPLDVTVSLAHHMGWTLDQAIEFMADPHAALGSHTSGVSFQVRQHLGSWSDHVESWLDSEGVRTLTLCYEDMLRRPFQTLSQAARFVDETADPDAIRRAVRHSSFDVLREMERREGFSEASRHGPFFRRGEAGVWRGILSDAQSRRVLRRHGPVMERLGYAPSELRP